MYLSNARTLLDSELNKDWINKFDFTDEKLEETKLSTLEKLKNVASKLFEFFNLSVISGEYIKNNSAAEEINLIIAKVELASEIEIEDNLAATNYFSEQILNSFTNPIIAGLRHYLAFISFIQRRSTKVNSAVLFDIYTESERKLIFRPELDFKVEERKEVFLFNLELAREDHTIAVDKDTLESLLLIKHSLKQIELKEWYHTILEQKCNYLIYKIIYRYEQDEKNYLYAYNFKNLEIKKDDLECGIFKDYKSITESHYEERIKKTPFYNSRIEEFYRRYSDNETIRFIDFHAVIKCYKDDNNSIEQLKNLFENVFMPKYEVNKKGNSLKFDTRANEICYNYFYNNLLSLRIDFNKLNDENIEEEIEKIRNLQDSIHVKNYFPFYKLLIFLSDRISILFSQPNLNYGLIRSLMSNYESCLKYCLRNFDLCQEIQFLAFQLPYEECIVNKNIDGVQIDIFLASSFVLPLNYSKLQNEIEEFKENLLKFRTMLAIQEGIKIDKDKMEHIRKLIDQTDKRSIEILSIFSAIVLFVLGDIQIFTKLNTFDEALKFMLVFAFSLCLFVLLIWFITRPEGFSFKRMSSLHMFIIIFFIIGFLVTISMIKNLWPFQFVQLIFN